MKSRTMIEKVSLLVAGLFLLLTFSACGGGSAVKSEEGLPKETPLEKKYNKIIFKKFQVDPKIEADYPGVVAECETTAIAAIKLKNIFDLVETENADKNYSDALIVKTRITNLRIVSGSARFWFGAAAGGSDMSLLMELIDASTGNVVREKALSTANNPFAAVMTGGGTDRSLSSDLGKIIAEYISLIHPQKALAIETSVPKPSNEKISENLSSAAQTARTFIVIKTATIRSEPNTKSKILVKLKPGTKVEFLGESGSWLNIKLSTGITGWVIKSLVTEQK